MADDGIIRIGTEVDVSALRSGMDQAAEAVQASTQTMAEAMEAARTAAQNLAEAQEQFGAAAAAGSAQATAVLAQYQAELQAARAAVASLASTEAAETSVLQQSISSRMAATTELRLLSGNIFAADRAAGTFLATLPGVAPLMQAAFVPFAVTGLVLVLGQAIEGVEKFVEDARELANETGTGWLQGAIGEVDGLADAVKQADTEIQNLSSDLDSLIKQSQQEAIHEISRTHGPAAGMRAEAEALQQTLTRNQAILQTLQADQASLPKEIASFPSSSMFGRDTVDAIASQKAAEALRVVKAQIADLDQTDLNLVQKITDLQAEAADQKDWISPAAREQEQAAKRWQTQVQEMSKETDALVDHVTKAQSEALDKIAEISGGNMTPVLQSISRQIASTDNEAAIRQLEQLAEAIGRVSNAAAGFKIKLNTSEDDAALDKAVTDYQKLGDAQIQSSDISDKNAEALKEAGIRAQEATHMITPLAAAQKEAALHAESYALALKKLNEQLEVYKEAGKSVEAAQTQNQILQLQGNRAAQQVQDQSAIQQQIAQPWLSAFDQINQGWLQVQNRMLFTTRNIGLEFAKMGQNIVIWGLDAAEKWALQWIEKELLSVVFHHTANAQKAASDTAYNATALTTGITTNVALSQSYAAVAAAAAAASVAAIPIIGWAMAPEVGSATYAEVSAFSAMASFDTGAGYVPYDGVAMIHQGEMVLPAPTADELRNGDAGADVHIHQQNNWNSMTDREFKRQIDRHAASIAGAVRKHLRQAGRL